MEKAFFLENYITSEGAVTGRYHYTAGVLQIMQDAAAAIFNEQLGSLLTS